MVRQTLHTSTAKAGPTGEAQGTSARYQWSTQDIEVSFVRPENKLVRKHM